MQEIEKNRSIITRFSGNITLHTAIYTYIAICTYTCNIHMYAHTHARVCVCVCVCVAYISLIILAIKEQFVHILLDIVSIHIWSPKDCKYVYLVNY